MNEMHEIENSLFEPFKTLFDFQTVDIEGFEKCFADDMRLLDYHAKAAIEQPISLDEVKTAIENVNPGKPPGQMG